MIWFHDAFYYINKGCRFSFPLKSSTSMLSCSKAMTFKNINQECKFCSQDSSYLDGIIDESTIEEFHHFYAESDALTSELFSSFKR